MSRDFGYYWLRLVIYIVVTVCIGTIYLNVGTSYNSILARGACASFVFGFVTFMSIGGFPSFVEDMKESIITSVSKRENEWAPRGGCICNQQHTICNAISPDDHIYLWNYLLFHGPSSFWVHSLSLLRIVPLCKCHRCGKPHDGYSKHCSQLPCGNNHRRWYLGNIHASICMTFQSQFGDIQCLTSVFTSGLFRVGTSIRQPDACSTKNPRGICVSDRRESIKMGRSQCHLLHDCHIPHNIFPNDQDQRRLDAMAQRLYSKTENTAEKWKPEYNCGSIWAYSISFTEELRGQYSYSKQPPRHV